MADITAKLIWYRLTENYESLAQSYEEFSWRRVDILDMLFLGWVLVAFVVVGLANLYLRVFGLPKAFQRGRALDGGGGSPLDGTGLVANSGGLQSGETAQWINSVVAWFCENYSKKPALIESWLKLLSEEARKFSEKDIQIRFDGIQSEGSLPQFSNISTDARDKVTLTILTNLTCSYVTLPVSVITKTATHMQTVGCQVRISKLFGPLRIQWKSLESPDRLLLSFYSMPEIVLHVSPNSYGTNIEPSLIESIIQKTINKVVLHLPFPSGEPLNTVARSMLNSESPGRANELDFDAVPSNADDTTAAAGKDAVGGPASDGNKKLQKLNIGLVRSVPGDRLASFSDNQSPSGGLRLLVKLIKANGLMDKDFTSCDPYCTVSADEPCQQHSTSVVKNTINPFFDEYFLLDINNNTKQIKFEVYDRSKSKGDDLLGQASVGLDDLRRMPSSRQIIPLSGRPKTTTTTSGSVTVEFLFLESNDALSAKGNAMEPSPPRRRIEMNRALMPGGMTVTTKTTTTERLRDLRDDPLKYYESPTKVEKAETVSSYASDSSPYRSGTSSRGGVPSSAASSSQDQIITNGMESVTETALRQLSRQSNVPSQSATIVITGVQKTTQDAKQEKTIPVIMKSSISSLQTTKPPNSKPSKDNLSQSGVDHHHVETKKKSFASALKKRFSRNKKSRSQSADRAQTFSNDSLLRPPEHGDTTISDQSEFSEGGTLRKSRSHSFSSSFRNLFRRKKKSNMSRESSMSRISARGMETSREGSIAQQSPQLSQQKGSIARHNTPVPEFSPTTGYPYSTSVPARPSPLYDH